MTLEKVVPTLHDAMLLLRLLCRNATSQKISAYVTMDSGPRKAGEIDGPDDLFIIILDNGRSSLYQNENVRDALRCIRCGACMYACPVYMKIGGYPYGWAYSGPLGQVVNPLLLGLDRTQDLYRACTLCGKCASICPGGIDHPSLFLLYRSLDVEGDCELKGQPRPWLEEKAMGLLSWGMRRAWRWNMGVKGVRPAVNAHARDQLIQRMPFLDGWFRRRNLPAVAKETFHEKMKRNHDREK
jgi:L-lactate dehydrogenase complex protein LldF